MLMEQLSLDANLEYQEQRLIEDGCSQAAEEDQAGCAQGVLTWWRRMASVVYTHEASHAICHGLEPSCNEHDRFQT